MNARTQSTGVFQFWAEARGRVNKRFSRTGSFSSANSLLFLYLIIKN